MYRHFEQNAQSERFFLNLNVDLRKKLTLSDTFTWGSPSDRKYVTVSMKNDQNKNLSNLG